MCQVLTFKRKSLVSGIGVCMLLIWASPTMVYGKTKEETGLEKRKDKRRVRVKSLRVNIRSSAKTLHQLKANPSGQAQAKANLRPKRFQVPSLSKGQSAEALADEKTAQIRVQRMKLLREAIHNLMGEPRARMMYRLAEEYWEHSSYLRLKALRKHGKAMEAWDLARRKIPQQASPAPKPNLQESLSYQLQAITVYKRVLGNFPTFSRAAEVTYTLGLRLMEMNKRRRQEGALLLNTFVKRWSQSRWMPEVRLALGDYFFRANKVNDAMLQYRQAIRVSRRVFLGTNAPPSEKVAARGVHLRALYYLAWCRFNVGDYNKALMRFKRVVALSTRYRKTKESRIVLRSEALRDMVRTFAKMNTPANAYRYFRQVVSAPYAFQATQRLAQMYFQQGQYLRSVATYRYLMRLRKDGTQDNVGPHVPVFQARIVQALARIRSPQQLLPQLQKLTRYFQPDSPWSKWRDKPKVWTNAKDTVEATLQTFSTRFHQLAQKEKAAQKREELYSVAMKLYGQYLGQFPNSESAYSLRFFWAELMYRKAMKQIGKRRYVPRRVKPLLTAAARQYQKVAEKPRGEFRKQALFSEMLCYEHLTGRFGRRASVRVGTSTRVGKRHTLRKNTRRLLDAYERYLKLLKNNNDKDKEERLQTYFKIASVYQSHRHYLKSIQIFSSIAEEFPEHEISRKAAFMILYGYEDLKRWHDLERNARMFLKNKKLTQNKRFRLEMYGMLMRGAFLHLKHLRMQKKLSKATLAQRYVAYEKEFGSQGRWVRQGFKPSPAVNNALGLAGMLYTQSKKLFQANAAYRRCLRLYPNTKFKRRMRHRLASNYEQIADYASAAHWFERYTFGSRNYLALSPQVMSQQLKDERKTWKKTLSRTSRDTRPLVAERLRQVNDALFKAAAYRRGLGHYKRAIRLFQHYIQLHPKDKSIPSVKLAMARIYEEQGDGAKALGVYAEYLKRYESKGLQAYLRRTVRLYQKYTKSHGLVARFFRPHNAHPKARAAFLRAVKRWEGQRGSKELNGQLIEVHTRMANVYRKAKQKALQREQLMQVDALGALMLLKKHNAMRGVSPARKAFAKARFHLVESRLPSFAAMTFVGSVRRDRMILRSVLKRMGSLTMDYYEVASLQTPEWVLASIFRVGFLYHQLARKISQAPVPRNLTPNQKRLYQGELGRIVMRMEERALDTYNLVLKKSSALGLYNRWVKRCESARDTLNQKQGQVNPHTIFSERKPMYWLSEPNVLKVTLKLAKWAKTATRPLRRLPPKVRSNESVPLHRSPLPTPRRDVLPVRPRGAF
ncbi:MAG: tetratricopeptide repeat protein [Deltaproteobacteria bacterium]|nr:MAG: tetratricopeptide repeat protein [Deltaproteobacteria bacterium]